LPVLQREAFFSDCFPHHALPCVLGPSFRDRFIKILFFAASVRDLFVRQLYWAERFFPAIENCGGVCEEEASKEDRHKKR
jgi:hypothetical protein